jgi:anti-sigma B factor antagonist
MGGGVIEARREGEVDVLSFAPGSELTSQTAMRVVTAVLKAITAPYHVVLDCSALEALDSAGLGAIVQAYRKVRQLGGELVIASVPEGYARNIFFITRLDTVLELYGSVSEALESFRRD